MGLFLETEKARQARFKATWPHLSAAARADGMFMGRPRPFCPPEDKAEENLCCDIRERAIAYFAEHSILWHDGRAGKPSNHLCDSQVCCANFLSPWADKPALLADLLRPVFPSVQTALPLEDDHWHVTFEWIGRENYLGERVSRGGKRTRGANCTSADAAVLLLHSSGRRQMLLIEWKYTESYSRQSLRVAKSGVDRTQIYQHLYDREDCPIAKDALPGFDALFYEPFYQLMRQQFLAHEMERARENNADMVSVLHIAPAHNRDFLAITSPALAGLGSSAVEVWKRLVAEQDRFISVSTEELFGPIVASPPAELRAWADYIAERYSWLRQTV